MENPESGRQGEETAETRDLKEYTWTATAEHAQENLSGEILENEKNLKAFKGDIKEGTDLHKRINELAQQKYQEREKSGEPGTKEGDFLAAIKDSKNSENIKQDLLNQKTKRLEILSSIENGSKDEELNKRAYELWEESKKQGKELSAVEANDQARIELLAGLGKLITDEEIKKAVQKPVEKLEADKSPEPKEEKPELKVQAGTTAPEAPKTDAEATAVKEEKLVETFDKLIGGIRDGGGAIYGAEKEKLDILYEQVNGLFKDLTGQDLEKQSKERAKLEAQARGRAVMKKSEWNSPENKARFEKAVDKRMFGAAIMVGWEKLSPEDKQQYQNGKSVREGQSAYIKDLEIKRKELAGHIEKGNGEAGIEPEVFYGLISKGFDPRTLEVKQRLWGYMKPKVKITGSNGEQKYKAEDFNAVLSQIKTEVDAQKQQKVQEAMDKMYGVAVANWKKRNIKAAGEIIVEKFGTVGLAKGLGLKNADARIISGMSLSEAAKEVWTPRIISLGEKINVVEKTAERRMNALSALAEKASEELNLKEEEVVAFKKYIAEGGEKPDNPSPELSGILTDFEEKINEINKDKEEKLRPMNEEKTQVAQQKTAFYLTRIRESLGKI